MNGHAAGNSGSNSYNTTTGMTETSLSGSEEENKSERTSSAYSGQTVYAMVVPHTIVGNEGTFLNHHHLDYSHSSPYDSHHLPPPPHHPHFMPPVHPPTSLFIWSSWRRWPLSVIIRGFIYRRTRSIRTEEVNLRLLHHHWWETPIRIQVESCLRRNSHMGNLHEMTMYRKNGRRTRITSAGRVEQG